MRGRLIVVIPAYNEEDFIVNVVKRTLPLCDEAIVVDDGSVDRTADLAREAGATVLVHEENMGKWAALRDGFSLATERSEFVIQLDGDGQHDPSEIPKFLEALGDADVAVGSRSKEGMPFIRVLSNSISTFLLRLFFSIDVSDSQCGYRGYREGALAKLGQCKASRFEGETESLILAKELGLRMVNVPIRTIYGKEKSKIRALRDTYRFVKTILVMRIRTLLGRDRGVGVPA